VKGGQQTQRLHRKEKNSYNLKKIQRKGKEKGLPARRKKKLHSHNFIKGYCPSRFEEKGIPEF